MSMEHWWNEWYWQGKTEVIEENIVQWRSEECSLPYIAVCITRALVCAREGETSWGREKSMVFLSSVHINSVHLLEACGLFFTTGTCGRLCNKWLERKTTVKYTARSCGKFTKLSTGNDSSERCYYLQTSFRI